MRSLQPAWSWLNSTPSVRRRGCPWNSEQSCWRSLQGLRFHPTVQSGILVPYSRACLLRKEAFLREFAVKVHSTGCLEAAFFLVSAQEKAKAFSWRCIPRSHNRCRSTDSSTCHRASGLSLCPFMTRITRQLDWIVKPKPGSIQLAFSILEQCLHGDTWSRCHRVRSPLIRVSCLVHQCARSC